jgi:hypothetical protein
LVAALFLLPMTGFAEDQQENPTRPSWEEEREQRVQIFLQEQRERGAIAAEPRTENRAENPAEQREPAAAVAPAANPPSN